MPKEKRTVVDITAMARWLGVSEQELLDGVFWTQNGKPYMVDDMDECKKDCIENEFSSNCQSTYTMAAGYFVKEVEGDFPDGPPLPSWPEPPPSSEWDELCEVPNP